MNDFTVPPQQRRRFTDDEMTALLARVHDATSTRQLLADTLSAVYDLLLTGDGVRAIRPDNTIDPRSWAIPAAQWQVIASAVSNRARQWGTSAQAGMDLVDKLPDMFDDDTPALQPPVHDYRPDVHAVTVAREATDVIGAAAAHLDALARHFGTGHAAYTDAAASWIKALTVMLSMNLGSTTHISPTGPLSLRVLTSSGLTYGITFHLAHRRCDAGGGCQALIADDGTIGRQRWDAVIAEHEHQPSFALDAPPPGTWSLNS